MNGPILNDESLPRIFRKKAMPYLQRVDFTVGNKVMRIPKPGYFLKTKKASYFITTFTTTEDSPDVLVTTIPFTEEDQIHHFDNLILLTQKKDVVLSAPFDVVYQSTFQIGCLFGLPMSEFKEVSL